MPNLKLLIIYFFLNNTVYHTLVNYDWLQQIKTLKIIFNPNQSINQNTKFMAFVISKLCLQFSTNLCEQIPTNFARPLGLVAKSSEIIFHYVLCHEINTYSATMRATNCHSNSALHQQKIKFYIHCRSQIVFKNTRDEKCMH